MLTQVRIRLIFLVPLLYLCVYLLFDITAPNFFHLGAIDTNNLFSLAGSSFAMLLFYKNWQNTTEAKFYQLVLFLAAATYWLADLLWVTYIYSAQSLTVPQDHLSHIFYLLSTLFMTVAAFFILAQNSEKWEKFRLLFDSLLLGTFLAYPTLTFLVKPLMPNFNWSNYFYLYLLFSAILDFFIILALFLIQQSEDSSKTRLEKFALYGFVIWILTDFIYIYLEGHEIYYDYPLINLFWPISLMVIGLASFVKINRSLNLTYNPEQTLPNLNLRTNLLLLCLLGVIIITNYQNWLINLFFLALFIIRQLINKHLQMYESLDMLNRKYQITNNELLEKVHEIHEINLSLEDKIVARTKDLHMAANIDPLTNIPNRRNFNEYLTHLIQNANAQTMFALLIIDLDKFKYINDHYGHEIGDKLLISTARKLQAHLHSTDFLARYGGDEFVIILNNLRGVASTIKKTNQLLDIFQKPFYIGNHKVLSTISIGISIYPLHAQNSSDLVRFADIALYNSKYKGKNRVSLFTDNLLKKEFRKLEIESNLCKALSEQELFLNYQPQIRLLDDKLVGIQAFVRWQSPDLGLVEPKEFIPIAEESGLITQVNHYLFEKICQDIKFLNETYAQDLSVCAHISAKEFSCNDFPERIKHYLQNYNLKPHWLTLEISEAQDPEAKILNLQKRKQLRDLGVNVALSDFGLGYTTLAYLEEYPINMLKISHELVAQLPESNYHYRVVRAIIKLCQELGVITIAKCVETPTQVAALRELGCSQIQGCYSSKPLSLSDLAKQLHQTNQS